MDRVHNYIDPDRDACRLREVIVIKDEENGQKFRSLILYLDGNESEGGGVGGTFRLVRDGKTHYGKLSPDVAKKWADWLEKWPEEYVRSGNGAYPDPWNKRLQESIELLNRVDKAEPCLAVS